MKVTKQQSSLLRNIGMVKSQPFGIPFYQPDSKKILMRVKPTGFLLNSNIVADVMSRGDVFVVDLAKGTVYAVEGGRKLEQINSELFWSEE